MRFNKVFIESAVLSSPRVEQILAKIEWQERIEITALDEVFGRVRKPYFQKRDNLNLFIAQKKGQLVKPAPPAYGKSGAPHFYFIHAYNCIYECQYCYLQGYFNSPDLVFFVNYEEIMAEIVRLAHEYRELAPWFHAGEFSDSLALSHITQELPLLFDTFAELPWAQLELRTKSVNLRQLEKLKPLANVTISFSLAPAKRVKNTELKTPSLALRLQAIERLCQLGFRVGVHLDPIIYDSQFVGDYRQLCQQIGEVLPDQSLEYVSLGVVRFTKDVFYQVKKNYPDSDFIQQDYAKSFDGKVRYIRPLRNQILSYVRDLLSSHYPSEKIYLCMEN